MSIQTKQMSPYDNVLYFPKNIDVRICPKNGMTTLKRSLVMFYGNSHMNHSTGNYNYRFLRVTKESDSFSLPFRKNSIRIAIRRDPVDRFKSACEYIQKERSYYIRHGRPYDLPKLSLELDEVIASIKNQTVRNSHFFTQTWYMGLKEDYDMIFHIDEMPKLLSFLQETCELDEKKTLQGIHENKTTMKLYNEALTQENIDEIKELYAKDYKNGWCKQDEFI